MATVLLQKATPVELHDMQNLAANAGVISAAYDLSASDKRWPVADFRVRLRFASAPAAGGHVDLYLIYALDSAGTVYEDATAGGPPTFPATAYIGSVYPAAVTTQQEFAIKGVELHPRPVKLCVWNNASTNLTNTANESEVHIAPYYAEIA